MDKNYAYQTTMQVRDYECDLQGIVNNANYLHYCEHTRHLFLKHCGVSFSEMHDNGEDAVVARMTLKYKTPLRSEDEFLSCLNIRKERLKYIFSQDIYRLPDMKLSLNAEVEIVCLVNGRLGESETCNKAFAEYL